ncbi:NUDIX hydrolase [Saccharothrix coeruleofusca]|uniref:NUDIX hydrolase n=1 Tax=Saccharothrix coeruleofusca TaxID=33919 RepID=A0A918EDD4_9PSEU|nr:NUDIX hydrolase [Saccharothrix coeruleofusca]GGP47202.1 NUDIX hydrolase [Saccharothrix coeruleofusca]
MGSTIRAAGAVLWRDDRVAVVHRPRYDDWSLPKGKLDPGETVAAAAVREVLEETGVHAVLGRHLAQVRYTAFGKPKTVDYYSARATSGEFVPNEEVDELRWLPVPLALRLVTRDEDREVLHAFAAAPADLRTLLLVRHAKAGKRDHWQGDDDLRPLSPAGWRQAEALRSMLPLWGVTRVHAAPRVRCAQTVQGVAEDLSVEVAREPRLSEEGYWPDRDAALVRLLEIAGAGGVPVVCSQGGVIPDLVSALAELGGVKLDDGVPCKKGSAWVLAFRERAGGWSTADEPRRWPQLVGAHYVPTALGRPGP